jgi:type I restriction enzyme S subunit
LDLKLSEVCTIKYGKDHKSLVEGKIPAYGSGGVMRYVDTAIYKKKSVLIPRKGTLNNLYFVDFPFWTVDTLFYTEIDETKIIPEFLYYQLKTLDLVGMNVGTAVPSLTTAVLNEIELNIPSLAEQYEIATTLSALDNKISINKAINHHLEQMAQAIYKSWFVDFEPYVDGGFFDSELGEIPIGWRVGLLSELITVKYGKNHMELTDGAIPVFGSGGIMRYVDTALYNNESVLIPRKGTLNNVIYVNQPFWSVDTMFFTEMKRPNLAKFIYFFVCSKNLASMNAGSAVPSMTTEILNALPIIIPPDDELARFENVVGVQFKQMRVNQAENENLVVTRDILLPRLMSGELSVADLGK